MKKKMKIFGLAALLLAPVIAYAVNETRIGYDKVTIGNSTAVNKEQRFNINLGAANPGIRGNTATSKIEFSHDGSTWKAIGSGGGAGGGGVVLNENFGFEDGTTGWTASGGTFTITSTAANVGFGTQAASWDASAASQTLSYSALTIPAGLYGKVCSVSWYYKGGDSNLKVQVYDGTNVIAESSALSTQATYSGKQVMYFTCPSSGTITPRLIASADAALVYVDDFKIGQELLLSAPSMAAWQGYFGSDCNFAQTNTSFADFAADASCTFTEQANTGFGAVTFTGAKTPGVIFTAPFDGTIEICALAQAQITATQYLSLRWHDGSASFGEMALYQGVTMVNPSPICGQKAVTKGSAQTWKLQSQVSGGTANVAVPGAGPRSSVEFFMRYVSGSSAQESITIDKSGWRVDAKIAGGNPGLGTGAVSSKTELTNGSLTITPNSESAPVEIPCSGTNPSTGTTCAAGSEGVGVVISPPTAGVYEVCTQFTWIGDINNGSVRPSFQLVETPNNAQTILQSGLQVFQPGVSSSSGNLNNYLPVTQCADFTFADTSKRTIRLMYTQQVSGTVSSSEILGDESSGVNGGRNIGVTVRRRVEFQDAVKFTNLATTSRQAGVKIEAITFGGAGGATTACTANPCTVSMNSGAFGTVTRNSTGDYSVAINGGYFSNRPTCTAQKSSASNFGPVYGLPNSAGTSMSILSRNLANTSEDAEISIICVGF